MSNYRQEIYRYYLGQALDPEQFIAQLDRTQMNRQYQAWWQAYLPPDKGAPMLDLGCGWGGYLSFLQSQGYTNLTGVDSSEQQVEIAHRLGLTNVQVGDVFTPLGQENHYACISAFNVLEHLDKDQVLPFLRAIKRSLRPGGCVLLELPNANSLFGGRTRYWDFTHELSFTPTSLIQIFAVVGFSPVKFQERAPVVHGLKSLIRANLWQVIRQILSFYLMVEQGSPGHQIFSQDMHAIAYKP
ncbi:MAG: class I SAM-dependent methyltransferase [Pseudanabaenaceae cyanobacterium bins.68]|nr:class I SAM-dependent methyltransferase [Pseudanabaenaceae cyanobacterium bins.68]